MKTKIIQKERNYIVLRNCIITDEEVLSLGGKAFTTGEFSSDPYSNKIHEATCEVLADYGVDTDEDVVVILDPEWVEKIDREICEKLRY